MFALPFALKHKIAAAHFTFSRRRLSGAFSHRLFYFAPTCASLGGLLFRMFGEANAFHESPGRLVFFQDLFNEMPPSISFFIRGYSKSFRPLRDRRRRRRRMPCLRNWFSGR